MDKNNQRSSQSIPDKKKGKEQKSLDSTSGVKAIEPVEVAQINPSPVKAKGKNIEYNDIFLMHWMTPQRS